MPNDIIGDLLIAQGLPVNTEATRLGSRWATIATAAVAALVVAPTTVAALEITSKKEERWSIVN